MNDSGTVLLLVILAVLIFSWMIVDPRRPAPSLGPRPTPPRKSATPHHSHPPVHLEHRLLAKALAAEIHIDEEHGFPDWMTPEHLATLVIEQFHRLAHEGAE